MDPPVIRLRDWSAMCHGQFSMEMRSLTCFMKDRNAWCWRCEAFENTPSGLPPTPGIVGYWAGYSGYFGQTKSSNKYDVCVFFSRIYAHPCFSKHTYAGFSKNQDSLRDTRWQVKSRGLTELQYLGFAYIVIYSHIYKLFTKLRRIPI